MNYVDTHHHLVLRERLGYAWIDDIAALAGRNFTLGDYKLDASGRIDDAYYMETGVDDADYKAEARLVGTGRLLIRKSGTEPLIRVMAEAEDAALMKSVVQDICQAVQDAL